MPDDESPTPDFDWRLTSFEGARREQLRRWARLPLERILSALEEMEDVARQLGAGAAGAHRPLPVSPRPSEGEGQGEGDPNRGGE